MKMMFKLEGLDCANCAAKAERGISAINGVKSASVNFLTTKMIIECDDDAEEQILSQAKKILKKVEPDVQLKRL